MIMTSRRAIILISISLLIATTSMLLNHLRPIVSKALTMSVTTPNLVIVVGSGLAGLSASSQLISHGVAVHLLERAAKPGGNSMKASSGINGAPTKYQPVLASSPDRTFFSDTLRSVGSVMGVRKEERERLIQVLTNESAAAVNWLVEDKGIDLSVVAQLGGHSYPRTHRGVGQTPPGAAIMTALLKSLQGSPLFTLETESIVTKVLKSEENGFVMGVKYLKSGEQKQLTGPVIFATGGFAGDAYGSLAKYRPDLSGFPSTNDPRPGSQKLLTDIGAQLLDMEQVQIHPTSFVDPANPGNPAKFLAAEMLRGEGGILLHAGKRFVNELETRKVVTEKIREFEGKTIDDVRVWDVQLVLDEGTYQACRSHVGFYLWKGLMKKVPISSLPSPASSLVAIRDHAFRAASSSPIDTFFSRPTFGNWTLKAEDMTSATEVYVGSVTPAVHFSMGGVIINEYAEVLDGEGEPIGEVWAAGEVTGGIHGENRLGGSSLLECVVFGRRSGDEAAKSVMGGNDGT